MHKNYNAPSKIFDEYLELAQNKVIKTQASRVIAIFEFYTTRLARQKFYLEKKISSESSRVIFKNGIHSTRSSFHCFASSEFRVFVEYFWRSVVIFMHLQKMFCPVVCNTSVVLESAPRGPIQKVKFWARWVCDYERLNLFWKGKVDKKILCQYYSKKGRKNN